MVTDHRLSRRQALAVTAAAAATALRASWSLGDSAAAEVSWLAEVQARPQHVPEVSPPLRPLLSSAGKPLETLDQWQLRRKELREEWLKFLGPMPARPETKLTMLQEHEPEGCVRQLVRYESEPGIPVEGYLLRPTGAAARRLQGKNGKLPAIVALHQTTNDTIDEIAGVSGPEPMQIGLKLCRRGFIVFCPRCFLWQGTNDIGKATADFHARRPDTLGMHKMLSDAMRGIDVLVAQPDVDSRRIGAAGHSLGAKEVLYLAAFDERVQAAVASEGGVGFPFTNWNAPWYLGPKIREAGFPLNHHELIALAAPRALLILAGEKGSGAADGDRTWPYLEAALPVYHHYRKPARLGLLNHRQGHSIPAAAYDRMAEWLETYTRTE